MLRQMNNSQNENYAGHNISNDAESQGFRGQSLGPHSPGSQTKYMVKNHLRMVNNDVESDDMGRDNSNQQSANLGLRREGGMTLEDDVESMLSENHLNQSNSSMFRVRHGFQGGQELQNGESTFRQHEESIHGDQGNDRNYISESEDGGWYQSEKDGVNHFDRREADDELSDISENSQDDYETDPDGADAECDQFGSPHKKKLKGEKRKKRKKKREELEGQTVPKEQPTKAEAKKDSIITAYKKLEEKKEEKTEHKVKPEKPAKKEEEKVHVPKKK